ncbi:MAG: aminotransferase class V-fold PLP-dependent enzyme [Lachnospiraceae bacterium]|nr:aminotransferase class V-fold PLP-dependent enzyme [Lachnospiraceae bacterium]
MIYLDNAATTMKKPKSVINAVCHAMESLGNSGRGVHDATLDASRIIFQTRRKLAKLIGAGSPNEIVFTMNSTESLNIAMKGLLQPGDHVITTQLEHNSVLRPLYEMEKVGVELTFISVDLLGNPVYEEIPSSIRENTKAVVMTHGSNLTGNVVDIERVGKMTKEANILFIVDASQTAGFLDIDVKKMGVDVLCFTGHKSLLGPQGTGGMYVRSGLEVRPLLTGGSGILTFEKEHPVRMPEALEAGTANGHGLAGLQAALDFIQEEGLENIRKKEGELMWLFYYAVKEISQITVYGDFTGKLRCPIVSLNIGNIPSSKISDKLAQEYDIATRSGGHCAPLMHEVLGTKEQGAVRFSFSYFNTKEDVERAVKAIREIVEKIWEEN